MLRAAALLLTTLASVSAVSYPNLQPGAQIKLSSSALNYSGQLIQVSWSGIYNPTVNDAILLQTPANESLSTQFPVRYRWASQTASYPTGAGTFTFKVLNERAPIIFLYLRNVTVGTNGTVEWGEDDAPTGFQDTDVVAASPVLTLLAPNEPTHVHMSYTDTEG
ncbi:hypothetical protein WJX84_009252, partial [Apatococcus fuscideae]